MSHLHLTDIKYVQNYISNDDLIKIKEIGFFLEQKIISLEELSAFLDLFVLGLKNEISTEIEYGLARQWYLKNLSQVIIGNYLDPQYDYIFSIEEIFKKYTFIIDYFVQLNKICSFAIEPPKKFTKIKEIMKDILMFDVYLKNISESNYPLTEMLHQHFCQEEESPSPRDPYAI